VPKISKIILLIVVGIIAVLFLLSISVNLYLQSQGVQQRISQAISDAIGTPVTIQRTSYVPSQGIVLGKIRVPQYESGDKAHPVLLTIDNVRLHISWIPFLFQRKLAIASIRLEKPVVILGEPGTPAESFGPPVPPLPASSQISPPVQQNQARSPSGTLSNNRTSIPNPAAAGKSLSSDSFPPNLPQIVISEGEFRLITKAGKTTVIAGKIAAQLDPTTDGHLAGPLTCTRMVVSNSLFFKNLQASLSCSPHTLDVNAISASLAGGKVSGEFRYQLNKMSNFRLQANGEDISLETLLKQAGYQTAGSSGSLRGNMYLAKEGEEKPKGRGVLELLKGQLESTDFLRQLGRLLRIQELESLHLKKAVSSFEIQQDRLVFDNIFLESENLILKGTGPMKYDGNLNINAQLLFNDQLYAQYQSLLGKELPPSSIQGYHEVAFHVTGQTASPRSDLLDKLTGIRFRGNVGGFLQQLIGWPHPKD